MTAKIDKYISVFNLGLQNTFVYRWNYFLRALFGLIPLAGTVFLWRAIFKERGGSLHGYDYGSMIYYYLLTILVSNLVTPTEDEWQIAADIREGQINSLLTKPMSYLAYRFSIFMSGRLVYTAVTLPPIALIFLYFRHYLVLPDRHFSRATTRRPTRGGIGNSVRLALAHLGRGACDVETRPRPLSSRRRLENLFFKFALILFRDRAPLMLRKIPRDDCLSDHGFKSPTHRHKQIVAIPFFDFDGKRVRFVDLPFRLKQFD